MKNPKTYLPTVLVAPTLFLPGVAAGVGGLASIPWWTPYNPKSCSLELVLLHFLFSWLWFKWKVSFSTRPTPKSPRFGLSSSISLFCPQLAAAAAEKFNCLLKIAGKMLNCWWSRLNAVVDSEDPPPTEVPPTDPTPPPGPVLPDKSLARVMPGWPCRGLPNAKIVTL